MKLLISLYDYTGLMVERFRQAGIACLIVDGKHPAGLHRSDREGLYTFGGWLERDFKTLSKVYRAAVAVAGMEQATPDQLEVIGVFGFPPCDDLASSGARWFESKLAADPDCQKRAAARAMFVQDVADWFDAAPWFAENPRGRLSTLWRRYDFTFNPYEFGGYLPKDDKHPLYPEYIVARDAYPKETWIWCGNGFEKPPKKSVFVAPGYSQQYARLGGSSDKTKTIRSATPRGWAEAVYTMYQNKGWI